MKRTILMLLFCTLALLGFSQNKENPRKSIVASSDSITYVLITDSTKLFSLRDLQGFSADIQRLPHVQYKKLFGDTNPNDLLELLYGWVLDKYHYKKQ